MAKRSKEERQEEFIDATEMILSFPMMPWQRKRMQEALDRFGSGRPVDICICPPDLSHRHKVGCPKKEK